PPPISILCPYTTLFRSQPAIGEQIHTVGPLGRPSGEPAAENRLVRRRGPGLGGDLGSQVDVPGDLQRAVGRREHVGAGGQLKPCRHDYAAIGERLIVRPPALISNSSPAVTALAVIVPLQRKVPLVGALHRLKCV